APSGAGLDGVAPVDRNGDERQIVGERQQPLRVQPLLDAEALGRAQEHSSVHAGVVEALQQDVGEQVPPDPVALAEVDRELQAILGHRTRPSARPPPARRRPATMLRRGSATAIASSPSSTRRSVSNIHVENVVYEPRKPVPTTKSQVPVTPAPARMP